MKKHSEWQKDRNRVRRLNREVKAIVRRDDARAEWFNSRFDKAQSEAKAPFMYAWFIGGSMPTRREWPSMDDMFIEVSLHEDGDVACPPGLYVYRGLLGEPGKWDALLRVSDVNTGVEEYMWFPRQGQRVVSCGEVGDTPWLD